MYRTTCLLLALAAFNTLFAQEQPGQPINLRYGGTVAQWNFYWFTDASVTDGKVEIKALDEPFDTYTESAVSKEYKSRDGKLYFYHTVKIKGLKPYSKYQFRAGKEDQWSEWADFSTPSPAEVFVPTPVPDRIALSWTQNPATSFAVTWRTDTTVATGMAQIAIATDAPEYKEGWQFPDTRETQAILETQNLNGVASHHFSVAFEGLSPKTMYAYRVGDGQRWSEWFHYTTASTEPEPFSFIYFGDAQNDVKSFWSRTIRQAFMDDPKAKFIIHAGDLINIPEADNEWGEWFYAGSFIHSMLPMIATPGNHEYTIGPNGQAIVDRLWTKQFTFPQNGPEGPNLSETAYYVDYQGVRIISLNSMEIENRDTTRYKIQLEWLDKVLADNPNNWTILTFHIPVFGAARDDSETLKKHFKPLFDKYQVDLVLQGHDHVYGRGMPKNQTTGRTKRPDNTGPVYVVSVSGPKMYNFRQEKDWIDRSAEGLQLYQILHVDEDKIRYEAYTTTGKLYDSFDLIKRGNDKPNKLVNRVPDTPDHRFPKKEDESQGTN